MRLDREEVLHKACEGSVSRTRGYISVVVTWNRENWCMIVSVWLVGLRIGAASLSVEIDNITKVVKESRWMGKLPVRLKRLRPRLFSKRICDASCGSRRAES